MKQPRITDELVGESGTWTRTAEENTVIRALGRYYQQKDLGFQVQIVRPPYRHPGKKYQIFIKTRD